MDKLKLFIYGTDMTGNCTLFTFSIHPKVTINDRIEGRRPVVGRTWVLYIIHIYLHAHTYLLSLENEPIFNSGNLHRHKRLTSWKRTINVINGTTTSTNFVGAQLPGADTVAVGKTLIIIYDFYIHILMTLD